MSRELKDAIVALRMDEALTIAGRMLADGTEPLAIIGEGSEAMQEIGRRYAAGEAFIPELIMGGEIMKSLSEQVLPEGSGPDSGDPKGTVVIGTVQGDIHDIGKDIVATILEAGGFEIVDLGVDVPPERFVEAAAGRDDCILGLSCLLTVGFDSMRATVEALGDAGLRDSVKIMLGGAPVTEHVRAYAGADAFGTDAAAALELARGWAKGGAR